MDIPIDGNENFNNFTVEDYKNIFNYNFKIIIENIYNNIRTGNNYDDKNTLKHLTILLHIIDMGKKCPNYINGISLLNNSFGCKNFKKIFEILKVPNNILNNDVNDVNAQKLINDLVDNLIIVIKQNDDMIGGVDASKYKIALIEGINEGINEVVSKSNIIRGGNRKINKVTKINKKEILGRERCIYKKPGDRKEYLKHKGELITVKDYKKRMKDKK
jgi:hypothetical protein